MKVLELLDIKKNNKVMATLRIYLDGSGNPADKHTILGFAIDGYGFGEINLEVEKTEQTGIINLKP